MLRSVKARRIASEVAEVDAALAPELVRLVAEYQFDQLLALLERAREAPRS